MTHTCTLCERMIEKYQPALHQLVIDEHRSINICPDCVEKFAHWQQKKYAALFPTKAAKQWLKKRTT